MRSAITLAIASIVASASGQAALREEVRRCELSELVQQAYPLISSPPYEVCQKDDNYKFIPFTGMPSQAQIDAMCASASCQELLKIMKELSNLPDCTVEFGGEKINVRGTLGPYIAKWLPKA